jgi:hypothetical protein
VQKTIKSHKKQKELNFLIIISALILALLVNSSEATSSSNLELSHSTEAQCLSEQTHAEFSGETGNSGVTSIPYESLKSFSKIEQYLKILYTEGD